MQEVPARIVDHCRVLIDTPEVKMVGDLKHLSPLHSVTLLGKSVLQPTTPELWFENDDHRDDHAHDHSHDHHHDDDSAGSPQTASIPLHHLHNFTFSKSVGTAIQDVLMADHVI
jgi:ABC-type Zn2+ transport system substrate-binding protein/surface adhesin